jgi:hypothetical protein
VADDCAERTGHPVRVRPIRKTDRPDLGMTSTACHACSGAGAMAISRAAVMSCHGEVWAYEAKRCADCGGKGWLRGLIPPV